VAARRAEEEVDRKALARSRMRPPELVVVAAVPVAVEPAAADSAAWAAAAERAVVPGPVRPGSVRAHAISRPAAVRALPAAADLADHPVRLAEAARVAVGPVLAAAGPVVAVVVAVQAPADRAQAVAGLEDRRDRRDRRPAPAPAAPARGARARADHRPAGPGPEAGVAVARAARNHPRVQAAGPSPARENPVAENQARRRNPLAPVRPLVVARAQEARVSLVAGSQREDGAAEAHALAPAPVPAAAQAAAARNPVGARADKKARFTPCALHQARLLSSNRAFFQTR
jgi:hypothetical protein